MHKVAWYSGLSLSQHHFQAQDNYQELLEQKKTSLLKEYFYGLKVLKLDSSKLEQGVISITNFEGVLPDGTPVTISDEVDGALFLQLETGFSGPIHLGIPTLSQNNKSIAEDKLKALTERYYMADKTVYDAVLGAESTEEIQVLIPNLRMITQTDNFQNYALMPILQVKEVLNNGRVVLDENYIPPLISVHGSEILTGYIKELLTLSQQRRKQILERLGNVDDYGAVGMTELLLIQLLNRYEPIIFHLANKQKPSVEALYLLCVQLSSELRTFTSEERGYQECPHYNHMKLTETFVLLMKDLREAFNYVFDERARKITLSYYEKYGLYTGSLEQIKIGVNYKRFVLVCKTEIEKEQLASMLPKIIKIASRNEIINVVNKQLPGIGIKVMQTPPRQIPIMKDYVYFELDEHSEFWKTILETQSISICLTKRFAEIDLQLWAVKG